MKIWNVKTSAVVQPSNSQTLANISKSLARSFVLGQGTEKFCETPPHLFMHTTEYIYSRNSQPGGPPCAQQKSFVHGTRVVGVIMQQDSVLHYQ